MFENMPKLGWCMNLTQRRNVLCFRSSMAAILLKKKQGEFELIIEETDQVNNSVAPIASSFVDKQATDLSISDEK